MMSSQGRGLEVYGTSLFFGEESDSLAHRAEFLRSRDYAFSSLKPCAQGVEHIGQRSNHGDVRFQLERCILSIRPSLLSLNLRDEV